MTNRRVHARGMAEGTSLGNRQTLRSNSTRYARALDRAYNLRRLRDKIGIASDHFKGA